MRYIYQMEGRPFVSLRNIEDPVSPRASPRWKKAPEFMRPTVILAEGLSLVLMEDHYARLVHSRDDADSLIFLGDNRLY